MVTFYSQPRSKSFDRKAFELECTSLDLKGRGVGRHNDVVWFVDGLIPGEMARVQPLSRKGQTGEASVIKLLKKSDKRVESSCVFAGDCGGCPLAHVDPALSLSSKADGIARLFKRQAKIDLGPCAFMESSPVTAYRRACRMAVRVDHGRLAMGFRGERSKMLCAISECEVLTDRINGSLKTLKATLDLMKCRSRIGHVELIDSAGALGISLRLTCDLPHEDEARLESLAKELKAVVSVQEPYVEKMGTDRSEKLRERLVAGSADDLYIISDGIKIKCTPTSFVQVNPHMNEKMIARVLEALDIKPGMKVIDLFCGLGNFTLPIAKAGAQSFGVDVVRNMILLAQKNAEENGIIGARFAQADLEAPFEMMSFAKDGYDAAVMDPGRAGAKRASAYIAKQKVPKVVLISCNPLAAVRDIESFMAAGYKVTSWGVFDMFPRTSHVETVFVMSRDVK